MIMKCFKLFENNTRETETVKVRRSMYCIVLVILIKKGKVFFLKNQRNCLFTRGYNGKGEN